MGGTRRWMYDDKAIHLKYTSKEQEKIWSLTGSRVLPFLQRCLVGALGRLIEALALGWGLEMKIT
jgi:hypothetical protein